jgi:predicted HTH domain antitoxin
MQVTVDLPDDISRALEDTWPDLHRQTLEAIGVEGYRTGALTESQVQRLLGFQSRFQIHALLKEHGVPLRYTIDDLENDLAAHRELGGFSARAC